ncbi:hypothetical protein ACHAXS_014311 [Conticribra weissflogii]
MESSASLDQGGIAASVTDGAVPTPSDAPILYSGAEDGSRGAEDDGNSCDGGGSSSEGDGNTSESDGESESESESDGTDSSDDDSHGDSNSDDDDDMISGLQRRRRQNIQRQMELRDKLFGSMTSLKNDVDESARGRKRKRPSSGDENFKVEVAEDATTANKQKKRGILLTADVEAYQKHVQFQSALEEATTFSMGAAAADRSPNTQTSLLLPIDRELEKKYPHRTFQIQQLASILDMNVQKTKMAWNMTENTKSLRNRHHHCTYYGDNLFSEASYQGNIKMPAPTPILVTGAGGCGKTTIVRDVVKMIRLRANNATTTSDGVSDGIDSHAEASGKDMGFTEPIVAEAYVDCASGESGSVSSVLNHAFRQLHRWFYPKQDEEDNESAQRRNPLANGESVSRSNKQTEFQTTLLELQEENDDGDDDVIAGSSESDADELDDGNDSNLEENLERMRKTHFRKRLNKKQHRQPTPSTYARRVQISPVTNTRQTRHSLAARAQRKPSHGDDSLAGFKESASGTAGSSKESVPVAFFGRALSTLLQGGHRQGISSSLPTSRRRISRGRCAILILDNAERIMSWRQQGSKNALLQIMRLPSLMGLNLTLILITRSAVLQYSRECALFSVDKKYHFKYAVDFITSWIVVCFFQSFYLGVCHHVYMCSSMPTTVSELVRPVNIHFEAYSSIDAIKTVLNVPHMKFSIIGLETTSEEVPCIPYSFLRSKLHDMLYNSMLNMFLPSIERRTRDLSEISRLARMLWKEYVAPLDSIEDATMDQSIHMLMKQIFVSIYSERRSSMNICSSNCNFCQQLSSKSESNPIETKFGTAKTQLIGKLDQRARESMRILLSTCVMMPGRVIRKEHGMPYPERLPYTTKFLLLSAYLCQNKRPDHDANLYTSKNTGKSRKKVDSSTAGSAYATTSSELKQITGRTPTFPLERMLSIFSSIVGQYGTFLSRRDDGAPAVAPLGTERLFRVVSQLRATGLLEVTGKIDSGDNPLDLMHAKLSCNLSREDAKVIAASVDFPLETYCP